MSAKILLLDIENAPCTAYTWGLFNQNIGINQIVEDQYLLSWAAKWLDEDEVMWDALPEHKRNYKRNKKDDKAIAKSMHKLMQEADVIVGHNGDRFDLPKLNAAFLKHGLDPIPPYKTVDTLKAARHYFKFTSNRLDFLGTFLGVGNKIEHEGFPLWTKCMEGDMDAWERMVDYNKQDVLLLERVYIKLRPYIRNHPNLATFNDKETLCCPNCESEDVNKRGFYRTNVSKFQRYKCNDCRTNFRGSKNLRKTTVVRNAL